VKVIAAALLSLGLTACAPAMQAVPARPASQVSQWHDGAEEAATIAETAIERFVNAAPAAVDPAEPGASASPPGFEPDVVHRARIAMAREALVEDNLNKARLDLAEELQRELAELQENSQTSKSRVKHGKPTKKQP
jgi:hypothetical protein